MKTKKISVGIIGAGMSGIAASVYLMKRIGRDNLDIAIFEKKEEVGGTWAKNSSADYPNAACDVQSIWYSFSFAPYTEWKHSYSYRAQIQEYLDKVVKDNSLCSALHLNTAVLSATWRSELSRWHVVYLDHSTGETHERDFQFLIAAPGALSEPRFPDIPHRESFQGASWHSARWNPKNVDYDNLRVGVIGTGASSIQIVPGIADKVKHLTVFQRTPPWIVPRGSVAFTKDDHEWFQKYPLLFWLYRLWIALEMDVRYWVLVLPIAAFLNNIAVSVAKRHLFKGTRNKKELRPSLTPDYPIACKRILLSDDYYQTLCRDDVTLDCGKIERITPKGVLVSGPPLVPGDGRTEGKEMSREVPLDVIIYATGFDVIASFSTMKIVGMNGQLLSDEWDSEKGPEAYLGTFVSGYPNFAVLMGPNVGLGHSSMIAMIESQCHLMSRIIHHTHTKYGSLGVFNVRKDVQKEFNEKIQSKLQGMVWANCLSWYNFQGRKNTTMWPGTVMSYWWTTRFLRAHNYEFYDPTTINVQTKKVD